MLPDYDLLKECVSYLSKQQVNDSLPSN